MQDFYLSVSTVWCSFFYLRTRSWTCKWGQDYTTFPLEEGHPNTNHMHIVHIHCLKSWSPPNGTSGPSVSEIIKQIPSWFSLFLSQRELLSSCAVEEQPFWVGDETSITVNVLKETLGYPNYRKHRLAQFTRLIKSCALFN